MLFNFLNNLFNEEPSPKKKPKTPAKHPNTVMPERDDDTSVKGGVKRLKSVVEQTTWLINEQDMPVEIHREKRTSWRYAFAKGGKLIVRLPVVNKAHEAVILADIQKAFLDRAAKKPTMKASPPAGVPSMLGGAPTNRGMDDGEE